MTQSGSPAPWKAPAIKGLSSGALQNTTSLAAPMHSRSAVRWAVSLTMLAHLLHGVHVDARLGGAHVDGGAHHALSHPRPRGCFRSKRPVPGAKALVHQGGVPADEVDPHSVGRPCPEPWRNGPGRRCGQAPAIMAMGVTEMRLLMMGMPYCREMSSPVFTRSLSVAADFVVDLLAGLVHIGVDAVQQGDAHGDGADIQALRCQSC